MTGKHPGNASIRGNWGWLNGTADKDSAQRVGITANDQTIGEMLKKAGYATAHCGKWHLETEAKDSAVNWAYFRGYDFVIREHFTKKIKEKRNQFLEETGVRYDDNYPYQLWKNGKRVIIEENIKGEQNYLMDDITTDYGIKFIKEHKDEPFFVFFSMKIPHVPETLHTLDTLFKHKGWPECRRVHAARVVYHDRLVGKIVSLIDSLGLSENTLIVYSSDNGGMSEGAYKHPSIDPCKHDHKFFDSNAPLRGCKRDLYEGGIRVPFIARWTNTIKPGTVSNHIGVFWDMPATFVDVANSEMDKNYKHDGISILPELTGKKQQKHDFLYWEYFLQGEDHVKFRQAIRINNWKAVRYEITNPIEIYDLNNDIGEQNDLSKQKPEVVKKVDSLFKAARIHNKYYPYGGIPKK